MVGLPTTPGYGKGAFRRFKDVLMSYPEDRERWFVFRSERLRVLMEAWLAAHGLRPVPRPVWTPEPLPEVEVMPESHAERRDAPRAPRREASRRRLLDAASQLGPHELETLASFAEFLAERAARGSRGGAGQGGALGGEDEGGGGGEDDDAGDGSRESDVQAFGAA